MGLGQLGPGFAYFLGAFGETDQIQTRGLVDLFWRSCWHDCDSTLYTISVQFPDNAKPMSRRMRSRCQRECEADVKGNFTEELLGKIGIAFSGNP